MELRKDNRPILNFAKLKSVMPMPNLLDVQLRSFEKLVEPDLQDQWDFGLDRVFGEIFPIEDVTELFLFEYVSSALGEPKYSEEECTERDMTYSAPLKATLRLIIFEQPEVEEPELKKKKKKKKKSIPVEDRVVQDIIEKEVYLGDLPLLTELGTFIVNGAERVVVSQLHRSPGVVFEENIHPNGTKLYSSRIIPFRGSWVEFTLDINDVCYVHIDKKKKFPATALLRALGYSSDADIFNLYYRVETIKLGKLTDEKKLEIEGKVIAEEFVDPETGEILIENGEEIEEEVIEILERLGVKKLKIYVSDRDALRGESPMIKNTIKKDPTDNEAEALNAIYSLLRPGDAPN
ncbi:MAG: DNA-directed RNA polymerase subunit beta, partial [Longimicrobiales bacterium]